MTHLHDPWDRPQSKRLDIKPKPLVLSFHPKRVGFEHVKLGGKTCGSIQMNKYFKSNGIELTASELIEIANRITELSGGGV